MAIIINRKTVLADNSPVTDETIVKAIANGNIGYFEYLLHRYHKSLYKISRSFNIDEHVCDFQLRNSFVEFYENLKSHCPEKFKVSLIRHHINHCILFKSKEKKYKRNGYRKLRDIQLTEMKLVRKELNHMLEDQILQLPDNLRLTYILKELENLHIKDIAASLYITELKVNIRLFKARLIINKQLSQKVRRPEIFSYNPLRAEALVTAVMSELKQFKFAFAH